MFQNFNFVAYCTSLSLKRLLYFDILAKENRLISQNEPLLHDCHALAVQDEAGFELCQVVQEKRMRQLCFGYVPVREQPIGLYGKASLYCRQWPDGWIILQYFAIYSSEICPKANKFVKAGSEFN